jgi:16S rRNA (adenine1518-N6/adenine1519-N6)-dimethyltransferase
MNAETHVESLGAYVDPRTFLSRHRLRPKDSFGQCFLIAEPVAKQIVQAIETRLDETVIEIGTGCGTLARMIAPSVRRVVAIERDRDLVNALRADGLPDRVELVEADAAQFEFQRVAEEQPTSVVGNLPYQITGKLVRALLVPPVKWRVAVVMVQKEVAARLLAKPGTDDWGVMGVFAQAACEVTKVLDASPRCFHPAPRVTSTVVKLTPRVEPLAEETPTFQNVVHSLFAARRKTALNGLAGAAGGRERAAEALAAAGIDSKRRPETFSIAELRAIAERL